MSEPMVMDSGCVIVDGTARFALMADGLARMEFNAEGRFEDRPGSRIGTRPLPVAFKRIERSGHEVRLVGRFITVLYKPDGKPFSGKNLKVVMTEGARLIWKPGQVDRKNLGVALPSMDYAHRTTVPTTVAPATTAYYPDRSVWVHILWEQFREAWFGRPKSEVPEKEWNELNMYERLAVTPEAELPPKARELIRGVRTLPPGPLSRSGYFLYDDSAQAVVNPDGTLESRRESKSLDYYLLCYGHDMKVGLELFVKLFGLPPLMPRYMLGLWYSRWQTPDQAGLEQTIGDFEKHDLPLDMVVLDLPWHKHNWFGFDWNTKHIPDPDALLALFRRKRIHTTTNVHPGMLCMEDEGFPEFQRQAGLEIREEEKLKNHSALEPGETGYGAYDIAIPRQAEAYFNVFHKPLLDQGVDFWWIDGYGPIPGNHGVNGLLWTNHLYTDYMRRKYPARRPMIFSRTASFGGHRYPAHFTGDTFAHWEVLANQVEQTIRAGNEARSYISHDIGGLMNDNGSIFDNPELYIRWVQFGALSPMFRLHSAGEGERRPWLYGTGILDAFRKVMRLRMELLPYLYTLAWESSRVGLPICRAAYFEQPDWKFAYEQWSAYYLGDRMYVAPVTEPGRVRDVLLPPGTWYDGDTGEKIVSDGSRPQRVYAGLDRIPHYYRAGRVMVKQRYCRRASDIPNRLVVELYRAGVKTQDEFVLYEDDGLSRDHERGGSALTRFRVSESAKGVLRLKVDACRGSYKGMPVRRDYDIRLMDVPKAGVIMPDGAQCEIKAKPGARMAVVTCRGLPTHEPWSIELKADAAPATEFGAPPTPAGQTRRGRRVSI